MIADNEYPVYRANDAQHCGCTCIYTPVCAVSDDTVTRITDPQCAVHAMFDNEESQP